MVLLDGRWPKLAGGPIHVLYAFFSSLFMLIMLFQTLFVIFFQQISNLIFLTWMYIFPHKYDRAALNIAIQLWDGRNLSFWLYEQSNSKLKGSFLINDILYHLVFFIFLQCSKTVQWLHIWFLIITTVPIEPRCTCCNHMLMM